MYIKVGEANKTIKPNTAPVTQYSEHVNLRQTPRLYQKGSARGNPTTIMATGLKLHEYFRVSMNYGIRPKISVGLAWAAPLAFAAYWAIPGSQLIIDRLMGKADEE